jgi:hypothetical protein
MSCLSLPDIFSFTDIVDGMLDTDKKGGWIRIHAPKAVSVTMTITWTVTMTRGFTRQFQ